MNILNRVAFMLMLSLSALYAQDCAYITKVHSFDSLTEKDRFCMVQILSAQISAMLPTKVDKNTVLSSLSTQGDRLTYHYDLDTSAAATSKEELRESTTKENCENTMLHNLLNIGVTLEYEYKRGNALWTRFAVDKKVCN